MNIRLVIACALATGLPCDAVAHPDAGIDLVGAVRAQVQQTQSDTTPRYRFDIPAQRLRDALTMLGRQTRTRIELSGSTLADAESRPVTGTMTVDQALRVMLDGSGLTATFRDAASVIVGAERPAQRIGTIVVTADAVRPSGYAAGRSISATKTDMSLRDMPQAITVVGRDLISDQSMQSMADVVRYVPGITMGQGEGHRDAPTIRGNASTADFFVDGVRDDAQYLRDLYNVDRVEALKGSNAMIFGRGGAGGVINRVTKEAQWMPFQTTMLEGGSFGHKRVTLDIGNGFGPLFAARINGVAEDSRQFRDATNLERYGINPTVAILTRGTLIRLGYEHFADRRTVNRGIPSFEGRPSGGDITTFFGDPHASRSRADLHGADALIERGSIGGVTLRNRTRFAHYDKFYQNVFPGAAIAPAGTVALSAYNNATDRLNLFNQTDVTFSLVNGALEQTVLIGAEVGRQTTDNFRRTGYFNGTDASMVVPSGAPTVDAAVEFRQSATDADNRSIARVIGVYAQNQLALGAHWQAIVGLRHDWFELEFHNNRDGQQLSRSDPMFSPRAGLVLKPVERVSLYANYSVSFVPSSGDQFSSLTVTTRGLEPERFANRELGAKWEIRPDLVLSAAAYRLDRSNGATPDPAEPTRIIQTGRQRTTGVEAGISGRVTGRWEIAGGYAAQRARIVSAIGTTQAGARVALVPGYTVSLWNRFQATRRLGTGIGVIRQADMYAAIDNTVTLPAFTRVDAAVFASVSRTLRIQLNVENLLDERYYATSHGNNNIMPGASRSFRISLVATP